MFGDQHFFLRNRLFPYSNMFSNDVVDPRVTCGEKNGVYLLQFRRCYFVKTHNGNGKLNLTEQLDLCKEHNATLFYQKSHEEARMTFRFHLFNCGSSCRQNMSADHGWYLRLALWVYLSEDGSIQFVICYSFIYT